MVDTMKRLIKPHILNLLADLDNEEGFVTKLYKAELSKY